MKKRAIAFVLVIAMGLALTACAGNDNKEKPESTPPTEQGSNNNSNNDAAGEQNKPTEDAGNDQTGSEEGVNEVNGSSAPVEMMDAILAAVEEPSQIDMNAEMIKDMYHFDPALAEQFVVKMPMMNVKTNEIAIFKLKDAASLPTIEEGIKQRATDVQKQFETYLPDQYENAKNYKIVTQGNYVLFVISNNADEIIEQFNSFFAS